MRRRVAAVMLIALLMALTGCSALPSEERSFAVVLGVSADDGRWEVHARVPTYQSGGGYSTASGDGETLLQAMSALDETLPMKLDLGQLRMILFAQSLAVTDAFPKALTELAARHDMRRQAEVCITTDDVRTVMDAMKPAAGTRLSKSIDVLLEARREQGIALPAALSNVMRMGERQQAVLPALSLKDQEIDVIGGYPVGSDGTAGVRLGAEEMKLISLMTGRMKGGTLTLRGCVVQVHAASAKRKILPGEVFTAPVALSIDYGAATRTEDALANDIASECLTVLEKLKADGCDALGLGREVMRGMKTMSQWHALNWPERYRNIVWQVSVSVNPPA